MTSPAPRDLEKELREWDGQWPAAWNPAPSEILVGVIERYSQGHTAYGACRTVIVRRDDGSRVSVWLSSKVLLALFETECPAVNSRIGLKYLGKHPEKGYRRWSMVKDDSEPDFTPLGGERDEQTGPYVNATMRPPRQPASVGGRPANRHAEDPFDV